MTDSPAFTANPLDIGGGLASNEMTDGAPDDAPTDDAANAADAADANAAAEALAATKATIKKEQIRWKENPANFHQASCVYLLGGADGERRSTFPRPENVSRFTNEQMEDAWGRQATASARVRRWCVTSPR